MTSLREAEAQISHEKRCVCVCFMCEWVYWVCGMYIAACCTEMYVWWDGACKCVQADGGRELSERRTYQEAKCRPQTDL